MLFKSKFFIDNLILIMVLWISAFVSLSCIVLFVYPGNKSDYNEYTFLFVSVLFLVVSASYFVHVFFRFYEIHLCKLYIHNGFVKRTYALHQVKAFIKIDDQTVLMIYYKRNKTHKKKLYPKDMEMFFQVLSTCEIPQHKIVK